MSYTFKNAHYGPSLGIQWLRLHLPMQEVQVQSLVRKLRSYMPHGQKTRTWPENNRNNIVTHSIKTLGMVHIKRKKTLTKKAQGATKYIQILCHTSVNLGVDMKYNTPGLLHHEVPRPHVDASTSSACPRARHCEMPPPGSNSP